MSKQLKEKLETIDKHLDFLQETYNVKNIGIFGSFVRNEQKKSSDIDILVEFSEPVSFFEFLDLEEHLSKVLKRKVDLVTKGALKPIIKKNILKEVVYA